MMISAREISVHFAGLKALDGVDLDIRPGEAHALLGPNGAGKTTLLNVLSGFIAPTSGTISYDDRNIADEPAYKRVVNGIARSFQTPRFIAHATVRENVLTGYYPHVKANIFSTFFGLPCARREERELNERVEELLARFDLLDVADILAGDVPLMRLRVMEIARCLALNPKFIFLDEPAAGSDEEERKLLAYHIGKLKNSGVGVLLVEHNFGFVKQVADSATVLAQGRTLTAGLPEKIEQHPDVIEIYLGGEEA